MTPIRDFLSLLQPLASPAECREHDAAAARFGIPEAMLMENASREALHVLRRLAAPLAGRQVWLFMGPGNNGGDAVCLARHLLDIGALPLVFYQRPPQSGAAAFHFELAQKDNVPMQCLDNAEADGFCRLARERSPIIVDGILGTGFTGSLRPGMADLVRSINQFARSRGCLVLALDVPSGLDAETGRAELAIRASATVTFDQCKVGLLMPGAGQWTGRVFCRPIGIPAAIAARPRTLLLDGRALLAAEPLPANSFKNVYGHVLVFGGAPGYGGAAHLAALAALKMGAGLVTACAPQPSLPDIKGGAPEIMTHNLGPDWPGDVDGNLARLLSRATALVIGPGMGRDPHSRQFLQALLAHARPPAVLDADALFHIADNAQLAKLVTSRDIMTPHPGEAAALLGCSGKDVQADRLRAMRKLCDLFPSAIVLKGAASLAGAGNSQTLLCPWDIPQLAIGGAGDVLAGCIGALLGCCGDSLALDIAGQGVLAHAVAGLALAENFPQRGALASDLACALAHCGEFIQKKAAADLLEGLLPWPC